MAYIDATIQKGRIWYWERKKNGELKLDSVPVEDYSYYYQLDDRGPYRSLFGDSLSKIYAKNQHELRDISENLKGEVFESDISPVYKFLSDNFYRNCEGTPHIGLYDIETDFDLDEGKGYPRPENPHGMVNSISLYDAARNTYHMIILSEDQSIFFEDEEEGVPIKFWYCATEKQILDTFVRVIEDIDVLVGWNTDGYDLPYLMARAVKVYGYDRATTIFSRDGFRTYSRETFDNFGNDIIEHRLTGRSHLDLMVLYKKFKPGEKERYTLDFIADDEEKVGKKVEYDGDLGDLYREDPHKFFYYSFHDTRLLKKLEDKLQFITLAIMMAQKATVKFHDVLGSIKFLEHAVLNYAHFDRKEPLILPDLRPSTKERFEGAYVIDTVPGKYGWTMSSDLGSLYPSVIRRLNMSPETFVMQCVGKFDDFLKVTNRSKELVEVYLKETGESFTVEGRELYDIIKSENYTISANGSVFRTDFRGLIPEVLDTWVQEREEHKYKIREVKDETLRSYHSNRSEVNKLSNNSLYGALSNAYCRFYDIDIASSITLTGQEINKFQAIQIDKLVGDEKRLAEVVASG